MGIACIFRVFIFLGYFYEYDYLKSDILGFRGFRLVCILHIAHFRPTSHSLVAVPLQQNPKSGIKHLVDSPKRAFKARRCTPFWCTPFWCLHSPLLVYTFLVFALPAFGVHLFGVCTPRFWCTPLSFRILHNWVHHPNLKLKAYAVHLYDGLFQ